LGKKKKKGLKEEEESFSDFENIKGMAPILFQKKTDRKKASAEWKTGQIAPITVKKKKA